MKGRINSRFSVLHQNGNTKNVQIIIAARVRNFKHWTPTHDDHHSPHKPIDNEKSGVVGRKKMMRTFELSVDVREDEWA